MFLMMAGPVIAAGPEFAVASIKPSAESVKFEHDGKTEILPNGIRMQDVTAATCVKWAYQVQDSQIAGPKWLQSEHFDITARADRAADPAELRKMMQALLADRFQLQFHKEPREMKAYELTVAKGGHKLRESAAGETPSRENSAIGTVARAITMKEFADFISGPLNTPVLDRTGLPGRYDFDLDFSAYIPPEEHAMKPDYIDGNSMVSNALRGELGLRLEIRKETVDVMVVDRLEKPSAN